MKLGKAALLLGLVTGVLISLKISSLVLVPLPLLALLIEHLRKHPQKRQRAIFLVVRDSVLVLWVSAVCFLLTNPYMFLSFGEFHNSMQYETTVATGTLPVFYTQEFLGTIPVLYQFHKIYPFLLNPLMTLLLLPVLGIVLLFLAQKKQIGELFFSVIFPHPFFSHKRYST